MTSRINLDGFLFCCKCAMAALLAYAAHYALGLHGAPWAPVSAVLVTHPSLNPSIKASMVRVFANLIGAGIGVLLSSGLPNHALAVALGVFLTGLACQVARLEEGLRSGCVAVLIILMNRGDGSLWLNSLDRMTSVVVGCASAILVTYCFDAIFSRFFVGLRKFLPGLDQHE